MFSIETKDVQPRCPACKQAFLYPEPIVRHESTQFYHAACASEICPNCETLLEPTSGGKKQCRSCGYLLTCCDTV